MASRLQAVRLPAVAGHFYPEGPEALAHEVDALLDAARPMAVRPKALVVPHGSLLFAGQVLAAGWRLVRDGPPPARVVLLGPGHHAVAHGVVPGPFEAFRTPLGLVPVDRAAELEVRRHAFVVDAPHAHEGEFSLEVQLPFLQRAVPRRVPVLPLLVGAVGAEQVAVLLEPFWREPSTLVVVSTDLSRRQSEAEARVHDARTARRIVARDEAVLDAEDACGVVALRAVLALARRHEAEVLELARATSAESAGLAGRVVGYGAFAVVATPEPGRSDG